MTDIQLIAERFEKGAEIGAGGMGAVFIGTDTATGERVAIKELKPDIIKDNPDIVERFAREGEALRKLNHPSIVKVLATAEQGDRHYIIMEYVDGGSLDDRIREMGQLPVEEILNIALDISDALARAHRLNIVHRDIKPANVLIAEDGTPRLTDFGVARIGDTTRLTKTGAIVGTLSYIAPEAINGEGIDARADLWAFGVMLYEMLTGIRPFDSDTTGNMLMNILREPAPDVLKHRDYASVGSWGLPGLIYWLLEKDRDHRPQSARLVGAVLENLLSGAEMPLNWFGDESGQLEDGYTPTSLPPDLTARAIRNYTTSSLMVEDLVASGTTPSPPTALVTSPGEEIPISRSDWAVQIKRRLDRPPRIFVSYRRADSIAVTGRIYDRLVAAFGVENVFKDMEDIHPGEDFNEVLRREVRAADVLLAVIGHQWVSITDDRGLRRLDDPNDFVRIEVATALASSNTMVIPTLIAGAGMPTAGDLPFDLKPLSTRNAAVVRNDPDFNRDVEWLIHQIRNSFDIESKGGLPVRGVIAALTAIVIVAVIGLFLLYSDSIRDLVGSEPTQVPITIPAPREGRYLALVAEPEHLGGEERNVQRGIVANLQLIYNDVPFAIADVHPYPRVVTSVEEAQAAAEEHDAAVILWGSYDADFIEINAQFGDPEVFPDLIVSPEEAAEVANARYRLTDERTQTLAAGIAWPINTGAQFSNDIETVVRNILTFEVFSEGNDVQFAEVLGNDAAAAMHRYSTLYVIDTEASIREIERALVVEPDNATLYDARALGYARLGDWDRYVDDVNPMRQFGPENWIFPDWYMALYSLYGLNDLNQTLGHMEAALTLDPDSWYLNSFLGISMYLTGDYETAQGYIDTALASNPQSIYPYPIAINLALRRGDFVAAQNLTRESLERFPDPRFSERVIATVLSDDAVESTPWQPLLLMSGDFLLGQWNALLADSEKAIATGLESVSDVYMLRGTAYCNLGQLAEAEAAYTRGIELDPTYTLLHMLRVDVRTRQGNLLGALQDTQAILGSPDAGAYRPIIDAVTSGGMQITCENFMDVDFEALLSGELPPTSEAAQPAVTPTPVPIPEPSPEPIIIDALPDNALLVLVAQPEHLGGNERDVQRFIVDDLKRHFEQAATFSRIRVLDYPAIIINEADAITIAKDLGAAVVIWGNYDSELVEMNVQVGDPALYGPLIFNEEQIRDLTDSRYHMINERRETLAHGVITTINMTYSATNGFYEVAEHLAVLELVDTPPAAVIGNDTAAAIHHGYAYYINDPQQTEGIFSEGIDKDASNPMLYLARSLVRQRIGAFDLAIEDVNTAQSLGPDNWIGPIMQRVNDAIYFRNNFERGIELLSDAIARRDDYWVLPAYRANMRYLVGDMEGAAADIEAAFALVPQANFVYIAAVGLALRDGDFVRAQDLMNEVVERFPNPRATQRILIATLNEEAANAPFVPLLSAFGNMTLGQWQAVVADSEIVIASDMQISDSYLLNGIAHCNLGNNDLAEAALTRGIELEPTYNLLYLLRADVRRRQGNLLGALQDTQAILASEQADLFAPLLEAFTAGTVNIGCETLLTMDLQAILNSP